MHIPLAEPFRARSMGHCLAGRHSVPSERGYSHGQGQNATSVLLCPRSSGLDPRLLDDYLLMNSLISRIAFLDSCHLAAAFFQCGIYNVTVASCDDFGTIFGP